MIALTKSNAAWNSPAFEATLKDELKLIDKHILPLQQGLTQSSHVADGDVSIVILSTLDTDTEIQVKATVFYAGIIAGSCCSDDPTPVDEQPEHCELLITINKTSAETRFMLLGDE